MEKSRNNEHVSSRDERLYAEMDGNKVRNAGEVPIHLLTI